MTPKEKAKELYEAMYNSTSGISKDSAKNCAIEAVKELIERDRAWCELMLKEHNIEINFSNSVEVFNEVIEHLQKMPFTLRKSYKRKSINKNGTE